MSSWPTSEQHPRPDQCVRWRITGTGGCADTALSLQKWGVVITKVTRFTSLIAQRVASFGNAGVIVSGDSTPYSKPSAPLLEAVFRLGLAAHGVHLRGRRRAGHRGPAAQPA